ncbi:Putative serine protease HtrA [bacterium HR19]|nr:Putative serine protease HtrA [bacterium HR19]
MRKSRFKLTAVIAFYVFSISAIIRSPCISAEKFSYVSAEKTGDEKQEERDIEKEEGGEEYEAKIEGLILDRFSRTPVVILSTQNRNRFVPIWIGFAEAMSIDMALRGEKPPRPLTHHLTKSVIEKLGGKIEKIKITKIKNNTYYAFIKLKQGNKFIYIDSRPSDAIALALIAGSKIFISKEILEASIKVPESEAEKDIWGKAGLSVQLITPELEEFFKSKGIVISDVRKGSPSDGKLKRGDIIISVNGKSTQNEKGIEILQEEISKAKSVEFEILREGKRQNIKISLE